MAALGAHDKAAHGAAPVGPGEDGGADHCAVGQVSPVATMAPLFQGMRNGDGHIPMGAAHHFRLHLSGMLDRRMDDDALADQFGRWRIVARLKGFGADGHERCPWLPEGRGSHINTFRKRQIAQLLIALTEV